MKNKFLLVLICMCMLLGFAIAEPNNNTQNTAIQTQQKLAESPTQKSKEDLSAETEPLMSIPEKNLNQLKNIGQNTPQNKFLKFIIAMIGVVISGLAIYGGLKLYKNIINRNNTFNINPNDERVLESPKDFKTAINIFLNKTDI